MIRLAAVHRRERANAAASWRQPAARVVRAFHGACHQDLVDAPAGLAGRRDRLDDRHRARRGGQGKEAQECSWPPAALARAHRCDAAQGDARHDLAPDRRPDQALCAGALPVRADRDGLDARPHDTARLRSIAGRAGRGAGQRVHGALGDQGEAGQPDGGSGRHHGSGGGHRASQRDGVDGQLRDLGSPGRSTGRTCAGRAGTTSRQGAQGSGQEGLGLPAQGQGCEQGRQGSYDRGHGQAGRRTQWGGRSGAARRRARCESVAALRQGGSTKALRARR